MYKDVKPGKVRETDVPIIRFNGVKGAAETPRSTTASDYKIRLQAVPQVLIFHIFYNAIYICSYNGNRLPFFMCALFARVLRECG